MNKVLIVIGDMGIGGAQKSLLSFLNCLSESDRGEQYQVELMVINPTGAFYDQIPEQVKRIAPPNALRWLGTALSKDLILKHFSFGCFWGELRWLIQSKLRLLPRKLNVQQKLWTCWKKQIPPCQENYDIAVSYIDGCGSYYVIDKVQADKKVLWVHSEYQKQGYDPEFDRRFYEKADAIVTVSQNCKACIAKEFPEFEGKIHILENITCGSEVLKKADAELPTEFGSEGLRLLTVARLNPQKGVDIAISAAALLKEKKLDFQWIIVGDGPQRQALQEQIRQLGLSGQVLLAGSRENPYVYMKQCHILVQPSRVEGRSIVLDEAKILCKPILATNYTTVTDALENGVTGWITDMTPEALAEGVLQLQNPDLRAQLEDNLKACCAGNEAELSRYIETMLS